MRLDEAARRYIGVKFLHQGRDPAFGIDCVGLVMLAARDCGLPWQAHDYTSYARNPARGELEGRVERALNRVYSPEPGDVVTMSFHGVIRHLGIIGGRGGRLTLIHTYNFPSQVIEHGLDDKWRKRISGIYRPEIAA